MQSKYAKLKEIAHDYLLFGMLGACMGASLGLGIDATRDAYHYFIQGVRYAEPTVPDLTGIFGTFSNLKIPWRESGLLWGMAVGTLAGFVGTYNLRTPAHPSLEERCDN